MISTLMIYMYLLTGITNITYFAEIVSLGSSTYSPVSYDTSFSHC